MERSAKIPNAAIARLSLYRRRLEVLETEGYNTVSSEKLAWLCQVNPAQVRKDLGYFGGFGVRGVGYNVKSLREEIRNILAVNREWNMAIVGVGNLGGALLRHQKFQTRGFHFVAAFDSDSEKIGIELSSGLTVRDVKDIDETLMKGLEVDIGVITTPYQGAQQTANRFVASGISAILNFSSVQLHVPTSCIIEDIDFSMKLDALTYKMKKMRCFDV